MKKIACLFSDDSIYFWSIVGALITLMGFSIYHPEQFIPIPHTPIVFVFLISGAIITINFMKNIAFLLKPSTELYHPMWSNELGLILGVILLSAMWFVQENQPFILHDGLEYQLLLWFLCARFLSFAGYALNRFGEKEVFHVFGDAMSVMVVCLVLSAVAGFDPNLFL